MAKERFTLIRMATVNNIGKIADETKLFSSSQLGTVLPKLEKYGEEHCIITERYDGRDWLYVEDSEIFKKTEL